MGQAIAKAGGVTLGQPPGVFGWILGGIVGGWTAGRIAARAPVGHGVTVGALLMLAGVANNLVFPPPAWFWVASLVVVMPAACVGARLAPRR